ncbi:MAG: hypothetical protein IJE89_05515 [Bacilli bacterium]|nr:hypothetical protein [Bacilli bacterium]
MNNKGFMMAEVIVVATVVLAAMVGFYVSYNKIISLYNNRVDYYDVATLYELGSYRDNHIDLLGDISDSELLVGDLNDEDYPNMKVFYLMKSEIINLSNNTNLNSTFRDYLEFLSTAITLPDDITNILVMEKCYTEDDCKYAYLEVFK